MLKILVCCAGGLSSSFLAKNLSKGIKESGLEDEVEVTFRGFHGSHDIADNYDIMMLCPHLRYQIDDYMANHPTKLSNTAIYVIPSRMYGLMQIKELYEDAKGIIEIFKKEGGHPTHFPGEDDPGRVDRKLAYNHVHK